MTVPQAVMEVVMANRVSQSYGLAGYLQGEHMDLWILLS